WTLAALGQRVSHERHVLRDRRILEHAKTLAQLRADLLAELTFFLVGDVVVVLLLGVDRLVGPFFQLAERAELRVRGRRAYNQQRPEDECRCSHTFCTSTTRGAGTLISKIATALLLPFTTTSPRGAMSCCPVSRARVASLMIMRVLFSLFRNSRRAPRFTLSPITV